MYEQAIHEDTHCSTACNVGNWRQSEYLSWVERIIKSGGCMTQSYLAIKSKKLYVAAWMDHKNTVLNKNARKCDM